MSLFPTEPTSPAIPAEYTPRPAGGFSPSRIVLAKGSSSTSARRRLAESICTAYPEAEVIEDFGTPHNRVNLGRSDPLALHEEGKRTLVLAEHNSAVRHSTEEGNSCPNYWHFSPHGFCPYGCAYCYLAGTQGVRFSPTVRIRQLALDINPQQPPCIPSAKTISKQRQKQTELPSQGGNLL